jgi:hypothetical protein
VAVQKLILSDEFCTKYIIPVEIVKYFGIAENGDLVLDGSCALCGHAAAWVIETFKGSRPAN